MDESTTALIEVSARRLKALKQLLNRKGISAIDPSTREGAMIQGMIDRFAEEGGNSLSPESKYALAEIIVSGILIMRSAVTHLVTSRKPSQADSERGKAQRQAFQIAVNSYAKASSTLMSALKTLNDGGRPVVGKTSLQKALEELEVEHGDNAGE